MISDACWGIISGGRTAAGSPPATTHIMTAALSQKENKKKMRKTTDSRNERAKIGRFKQAREKGRKTRWTKNASNKKCIIFWLEDNAIRAEMQRCVQRRQLQVNKGFLECSSYAVSTYSTRPISFPNQSFCFCEIFPVLCDDPIHPRTMRTLGHDSN